MRTVNWLFLGLGLGTATVIYFNVKPASDALAEGKVDCNLIVTTLQSSDDQATREALRSDLRDCIRNRRIDYRDVASLF